MLELMHFPEELLSTAQIKSPGAKVASKAEMSMATKLIESMTTNWKSEMYHDDYHEALEKLIEEKVAHGSKELPTPKRTKKATTAIDLVSVLQRSIQQTQKRGNGKILLSGKKNGRRHDFQLDGKLHRN
jgi:DNA end-binding protein Ku